jgi:hypothetical protein
VSAYAVESVPLDAAAPRPVLRAKVAVHERRPVAGHELDSVAARRGFLQKRLEVGRTDDPLEHEADHVAERVVRGTGARPVVQRACACGGTPGPDGECAACRAKRLEMKRRATGTSTAVAPPIVHDALRSPGRPLEPSVRAFFEPRFGRDFADVRVHTDGRADASARGLNAAAYTAGRDIVFAAGRYRPQTEGGRLLLAHELAHVVQQGSTTVVPRRVVQRYSHEDCTEADLRAHVWPADGIAKRKVDASIAAVTASPVSATTEALFAKYFMTRTPDTGAIAAVFRKVKAAFDGDKYTYECEEDCDAGTNAYSGWAWDVHLCMNNIRGRANDCIARTIIHEFTHKYAGTGHGWWFGTAACYNGCDTAGCPSNLTPSEALDNAYSYAGFAHEV